MLSARLQAIGGARTFTSPDSQHCRLLLSTEGFTPRICAEYVLVFTTLPREEATAEKVLELYRLRWQIELSFKRLKSIAQLGHLPKYDDRSSRAWLYGKLFLALLAEKMARVGSTVSPWGYCLPQTADLQQVA